MVEDDALLFLQIRNSIDSKILTFINHREFVKELMEYLEFVYSGKGNISPKSFYRFEKQDRTLTELFMVYTYEELNILLSFSLDVKVQQPQREKMPVMGFLAALLSEYATVKAQILSSTGVSSFQGTFNRILLTDFSSPTPPSTQMSSAPLVGRNIGESDKQQYRNSGPDSNSRWLSSGGVVFNLCRKSSHVIRDCKKR